MSPIFDVPARQDQVLHADRVDDVVWRQAFGLQRCRIEIDLDLRLFAAVRAAGSTRLARSRAACG